MKWFLWTLCRVKIIFLREFSYGGLQINFRIVFDLIIVTHYLGNLDN